MGEDTEVVTDGKKAQDFTFSIPTLKVKFMQKKSTATKSTVKTISCANGALVKKIAGAVPKCPAGYKKK